MKWLRYQKLNFWIKKRKVKKILEVFSSDKYEDLSEFLFLKDKNNISILERCFYSDIDHQKNDFTLVISFLFNYYDKESIFDFELSNGNTFKEELFINKYAFHMLKYFIENNQLSFSEKYTLIYEESNGKEFTLNTYYFILPILFNNTNAVLYVEENDQKLFNLLDEKKRTFFPYAIFNSNEVIINCLLRNLKYEIPDINTCDQIESAFYLFREKINKCLINKKEIDFAVRNLIKTIKHFNYNILNPYFNNHLNILNTAILEKDYSFISLLFHRFIVDLQYLNNNYAAIDYVAKSLDKNIFDLFLQFQQKYGKNYLFIQRNKLNYVNFLCSPFLIQLKKENIEKFNVDSYIDFFKHVQKRAGTTFSSTVNQFKYNFLHSICSVISNNFNKYFFLFKFFVEEVGIDPLKKNNMNQIPTDLIENKIHKDIIIAYLRQRNIFIKHEDKTIFFNKEDIYTRKENEIEMINNAVKWIEQSK